VRTALSNLWGRYTCAEWSLAPYIEDTEDTAGIDVRVPCPVPYCVDLPGLHHGASINEDRLEDWIKSLHPHTVVVLTDHNGIR
jgi:hypothetical protein